MPIRLLGDAVLRRRAWEVADQLGWASTYDAEYVALTQLQADAFVTLDAEAGAQRRRDCRDCVDRRAPLNFCGPQGLHSVRTSQPTIVPANGVELCVQTFGDPESPAILLIAGAASSMDWWEDEFCERLASGPRFVIRYDLRDTGQSVTYEPGAPQYGGSDLDRGRRRRARRPPRRPRARRRNLHGWWDRATARTRPRRPGRLADADLDQSRRARPPADVRRAESALRRAGPRRRTGRTGKPSSTTSSRTCTRTREQSRSREEEMRALAGRIVDRTVNIESTMTNHSILEGGGEPLRPRLGEIAAPTLVLHGHRGPAVPLRPCRSAGRRDPGGPPPAARGSGPRDAAAARLGSGSGRHPRPDRPSLVPKDLTRRSWSPAESRARGALRSTVKPPSLVPEEEIMSVPREGGCACGAVRYRLTSDPLFTHCCHCLNCQRQTGSAFVINLLIEADRVELLAGDPQPVAVPRGGGKKQKIWRCPSCQVAVFSQYTSRSRSVRSRQGRSTTRRRPLPTSTSSRGRSCPGSRFPSRCRRSPSTTTRRSCGRPRSLERLEALIGSR